MSTRPTDRPGIDGPAHATPRRLAGRATPITLGVVAVLALALAAVGFLAYQRFAGSGQTDQSSGQTKSESAIAAELGNLQTEFQTLMQEKLDLNRFEARVLAFTREHPGQADGYVLLAQVQTRMQKWGPAYAALVRALADNPQVVELHKMAGACAAKLDRLDQAQQHYRDAIAAAGSSADSSVYNALGQIYIARGDSDAAEKTFHLALKAPGQRDEQNYLHEARSGLADVFALRGDFEQAHQEIDRAIRLAGADSQADVPAYHIQKARLYMDQGRDADAVTMLSYTWETHPDSRWRIESARLRARLYERAGELQKAVNHIALVCDYHQNDAKRVNHKVAEFVALLAQWQIKAGQTDAAYISIENLQFLAPDHAKLQELRAAMQ